MAKKDAQPSRVYKSSDVHKRRVDRGARNASLPRTTPDTLPDDAPKRESGRTQFADIYAAPSVREGGGNDGGEGREQPTEAAPAAEPVTNIAPIAPESNDAFPAGQADGEGGADQPDRADRPDQPDRADRPSTPMARRVRSAVEQANRSRVRLIVIASIVVVALVAAVAGLAHWNRHMRYDDLADMQGTWYVVGTVYPVSIADGRIYFTGDESYEFAIDESAKSIDVSLGLYEGTSYYRFSNDRQYLVIAEDDAAAAQCATPQGLLGPAAEIAALLGTGGITVPADDNVIALGREPSPLAVLCKQTGDQVRAAKAEAEERARQEEERAQQEAAAAEGDDAGWTYAGEAEYGYQ